MLKKWAKKPKNNQLLVLLVLYLAHFQPFIVL